MCIRMSHAPFVLFEQASVALPGVSPGCTLQQAINLWLVFPHDV